jgi:hypothetical protein
MTRGSQREVDRARAQARAAKHAPKESREGTPQARNERDRIALLAKLAAKEAAKATGDDGGAAGGGKKK